MNQTSKVLISTLGERPRRATIFDVSQETEGNDFMNAVVGPEEAEEMLSVDVSDEALEIAGGTAREIAGAYTLQYCTSLDCALVS
jgi:hypothetical protein